MARRIGTFAMLVALTFGVRCSSEPIEPSPRAPLEVAPGPDLPAWAVGSFTHHHIDVQRITVEADGTVLMQYEGGDVGGQSCGRAKVQGGSVVIENRDGKPDPFELIRDADGAVYQRSSSGAIHYEASALCGRDGGGCGGYGRVAPCTPDERESIAARVAECRNPSPKDGGKD